MTPTTLIRTDSDNPDFQKLVALLDQDLAIRDGAEHAFYSQYNKINMIKHTIVAYQKDVAVGCGAIKQYSDEATEVKRMYVLPEYRGQGIAAEILGELEKWAHELGYAACILETGKKQPEAIRLYQKSGYNLIPNYGQYVGVDNSVCMTKPLNANL